MGREKELRRIAEGPDWLRRQPAKVQDLALGVHRARLFRANPKMELSKLGDAFRQPLTLAELAVREAQLFEKLSPKALREIESAIPSASARKRIQKIREKRQRAMRGLRAAK